MTNKMTRYDKLEMGIMWGAALLTMGAFMLGMSFSGLI